MTPLCLSIALIAPAARADGNAKSGAALFATNCAECHSVREGKDKKGPSLYAVVGRQAGAIAGFAYSDAMRHSGIAWTADTLDAYLAAPIKRVPGGTMKFDGLSQATERTDLIAYLAASAGK